MPGHRSTFSPVEAEEIKQILKAVRRAERDEAKALRSKLRRDFGFHISDFTDGNQGFTASDFDDQVRIGVIKVIRAEGNTE